MVTYGKCLCRVRFFPVFRIEGVGFLIEVPDIRYRVTAYLHRMSKAIASSLFLSASAAIAFWVEGEAIRELDYSQSVVWLQ